jgi:hypothetical protein
MVETGAMPGGSRNSEAAESSMRTSAARRLCRASGPQYIDALVVRLGDGKFGSLCMFQL